MPFKRWLNPVKTRAIIDTQPSKKFETLNINEMLKSPSDQKVTDQVIAKIFRTTNDFL